MDPEQTQNQIQQPNSSPINDGRPYFMGDYALIRFSSGEEGFGPEVYWLVDQSNHTIRPFESHMALDAAFGQDLQTALQYAIKEDGTSKPMDFSPHQLKGRYGKPIDEKSESKATDIVDGFLEKLKNNEGMTHIPPAFISKLKSDAKLMAFYISALAYGEYTLGDIYSDISHRYHSSPK